MLRTLTVDDDAATTDDTALTRDDDETVDVNAVVVVTVDVIGVVADIPEGTFASVTSSLDVNDLMGDVASDDNLLLLSRFTPSVNPCCFMQINWMEKSLGVIRRQWETIQSPIAKGGKITLRDLGPSVL